MLRIKKFFGNIKYTIIFVKIKTMKKIENITYLMMIFPFALLYSFVISTYEFFSTFFGAMDDYFENFKEY